MNGLGLNTQLGGEVYISTTSPMSTEEVKTNLRNGDPEESNLQKPLDRLLSNKISFYLLSERVDSISIQNRTSDVSTSPVPLKSETMSSAASKKPS